MLNYVPLTTYANQSKGPVLSGLMIENGLALLATHLINEGYSPKIFDYNNFDTIERIAKNGKEDLVQGVIDELDQYIDRHRIKMIGFKLFLNGFKDTTRIAGELKKRHPNLMTIGGGPQVDWFGYKIYDFTDSFDVLSYGDGDVAIIGLANLVYRDQGSLHGIPNLILKDGKRTKRKDVPLDDLPYPIYDEEVYPSIRSKIFIPVIEDSRGCIRACKFCLHPRIGGNRRERPIRHLLEEIEHNNRKYGISRFRLSGPSPSPDYVNELAASLSDGYSFACFGCVNEGYDFDGLNGKLIALFIGLETANEQMLKEVYGKTGEPKKYLETNSQLVADLVKNGIASITSMMIPGPDETEETIQTSVRYLKKINPDFAPVLPLVPMPDTPLTRRVIREGEEFGMRLSSNYNRELMIDFEPDLLSSDPWPPPPFQTRVDSRWEKNPFGISSRIIKGELIPSGISPLSDEIVLMASKYYGGLNANQNERRKQCNEFMANGRRYIKEGDAEGLKQMVETINRGVRL